MGIGTTSMSVYMNLFTSDDDPKRKPTSSQLQLVLDSVEGELKVPLNLRHRQVERELREVSGPRWKDVLSKYLICIRHNINLCNRFQDRCERA